MLKHVIFNVILLPSSIYIYIYELLLDLIFLMTIKVQYVSSVDCNELPYKKIKILVFNHSNVLFIVPSHIYV